MELLELAALLGTGIAIGYAIAFLRLRSRLIGRACASVKAGPVAESLSDRLRLALRRGDPFEADAELKRMLKRTGPRETDATAHARVLVAQAWEKAGDVDRARDQFLEAGTAALKRNDLASTLSLFARAGRGDRVTATLERQLPLQWDTGQLLVKVACDITDLQARVDAVAGTRAPNPYVTQASSDIRAVGDAVWRWAADLRDAALISSADEPELTRRALQHRSQWLLELQERLSAARQDLQRLAIQGFGDPANDGDIRLEAALTNLEVLRQAAQFRGDSMVSTGVAE